VVESKELKNGPGEKKKRIKHTVAPYVESRDPSGGRLFGNPHKYNGMTLQDCDLVRGVFDAPRV
jgi:hypothetical protein